MVPLGPRFPDHDFSLTRISETASLKDKLTIAQEVSIYITYGMVPLLVTLTD